MSSAWCVVRRTALILFLGLLVLRPVPGYAQDTTQSGVRVGITYAPGTRPTLAVAASDSIGAIIQRDLDQSDRFEIVPSPSSAAIVVTVANGVAVVVDARAGQEIARERIESGGNARMNAHRAADRIVRGILGQPGIAATRLLFVRNGRIMRVDADGANAEPLRTAGFPSLSPAWRPDGLGFAYTAYVRSGQPIVIQGFDGSRVMLPGTEVGLNITPVFSPDGRKLAFAQGTEAGTDLYLSESPRGRWEEAGAPQRLTAGRFADNLSPAFSPDGSRIAFISTRARTPQLYIMNADGTGQELLARFDFGATGTTSAPSWSPDGALIAFHRDVGGVPQVFVLDVASRAVRQLTGSSRNEDPSWAPDGRHLVFVSSRTGTRELWVIDVETGRLRQLTRVGNARLPAWSPRLSSEGP